MKTASSWRQVSFCLAVFSAASIATWATPLDDYVALPDASYSWSLAATVPGAGYTDYIIDLKSQTWLTSAEVNRTLWEHWLIITVPNVVSHSTGLLFIGGGNNGGSTPGGNDAWLIQVALATNTVVAQLKQVPNQPLTFVGDPYGPRVEDEQIAFCWKKFLTGGDPKWLSRLPMTKSAIRAMDAVSAFLGSPAGGSIPINTYVVAGGSKRGWTTWTTAAVDSRVVAFAPMVIDLLNLEISFRHHFDALGKWAAAIQDYVNEGITEYWGTPEFRALTDIVEPYSYRSRYASQPKFLVNSSGDQFFLPDSAQFYWDRLPGEKHLRYVPNVGHNLNSPSAAQDFIAWYWAFLNGVSRPQFTWVKKHDGTLEVTVTSGTPSQVLLWQATNPSARDFNIDVIGAAYTSSTLPPVSPGTYVAAVSPPPSGWTAFFVELTFPSGGPQPFRFTTEVSVVPDVLPFGPQYNLGAETDLLDAGFYAGEAADGSNVAGRMALFGIASNSGTQVAFYGVNRATLQSAIFLVQIGDPSSWRRINADSPSVPDAPIAWTPDDSAVVVGPNRIPIPPVGQLSAPEPLTNHGFTPRDGSMTSLPGGNWLVALDYDGTGANIVALPILGNGTEDWSRQAMVLTDLALTGIRPDWPAISADGEAIAFADFRGGGALGVSADVSDNYILTDVSAILGAPKRPGTEFSALAPTSPSDERITPIRVRESDNFAHTPVFSQDKSLVLFSEDWNNVFADRDFFATLALADFDVMIANADGYEADQRLQAPGNQAVTVPTRGGTRIVYVRETSGVLRLYITTLEVRTPVGGTQLGNNDILITTTQQAVDGSGTKVTVPLGTTIDFPAGQPQEIQIQTPVDPVLPAQLPAGVEAIPVVREFGPSGTSFSPPVIVTISYTDAEVQGLDEPNLRVFKYNTVSGVFDIEVTSIIDRDLANNTISFELSSFSVYGMGGTLDTDGDGIPDSSDPDDDNDGIPDGSDPFPLDTDNDGIDNAIDPDDDSDGIPDLDDAFPLDTDNDGLDNAADPDDDNDGIPDAFDAMPLDTDNDGLNNDVDDDDDNDGYPDVLELLIGTNPQDPNDSPAGMPISALPLIVAMAAIGIGAVIRRRGRALGLR